MKEIFNMDYLRKHLGFFKAGCKLQLLDKGIIFDLILKMVLNYFIMSLLWNAVFENTDVLTGWDKTSMMMYLAASVFISSMFSFPNIYFISLEIRSGNIANSLSKPYNYPLAIFMKNLGIMVTNFFVLLPIFAVYIILISRKLDIRIIFCFFITMAIGLICYILFDIIMGLLTFWTENSWGLSLLKKAIILFFTGKLFPIEFFSVKIQNIIKISPFPGMIYGPARLLAGNTTFSLSQILGQILWSVALFILAEFLFYVCKKKMEIYGG